MTRCPITYDLLHGQEHYSRRGLRLLSRSLQDLNDFPYTASEQLKEARARAAKLSIQGVQPKLSVRLAVKAQIFEPVDQGGTFILKPQNPSYPQLPENEDLSMKLAAAAGIAIPLHGLVCSADGSFSYFIKRFDRYGRGKKRLQEDFAQLMGKSRDTKYQSSMEQVVNLLEEHCTFPVVEKVKLFRRTLFSFLIGNEDMHLKNFSLLGNDGKISLSPAYDLLNSTLYLPADSEEMALPINGKKRHLTVEDLLGYFAGERLRLPPAVLQDVLGDFTSALPVWHNLINSSFLSANLQARYAELLDQRAARLHIK